MGRDTSRLSDQEIRTAALETLAENLSDGVIAPLFWLYLLGIPGMLTYKMINTMDSMLGYRTERFKDFGRAAARIDDAANYLPARLTALLMAVAACIPFRQGKSARNLKEELRFIRRYGPHHYFGEYCFKPYIGNRPRPLTTTDMQQAVAVNRRAEILMLLTGLLLYLL